MKRGCLLANPLQTKHGTALLVFVFGHAEPTSRSLFSLVVCAASQLHGFATGLLSALPERQNADLVTLCNRLMEECWWIEEELCLER